MKEDITGKEAVSLEQLKAFSDEVRGSIPATLEVLWEGKAYKNFSVNLDNDFDSYDMFLISYLDNSISTLGSCCVPASVVYGQDGVPAGFDISNGYAFLIGQTGGRQISFFDIYGFINAVYGLKAGGGGSNP